MFFLFLAYFVYLYLLRFWASLDHLFEQALQLLELIYWGLRGLPWGQERGPHFFLNGALIVMNGNMDVRECLIIFKILYVLKQFVPIHL